MKNNFGQFNLKENILKAIDGIGFKKPTKAQQRLIPPVLAGRDLVGESETGSGKTHAFLLPIFNSLDPNADYVQAVITSPSRELADQLHKAFSDFQRELAKADRAFANIRIANYIGGSDRQKQVEQLEKHQPQIVIGTPGRIKDFLKNNFLLVNQASFFVIDEADMALDLGFLPDVDAIASAMPENLQMLVFSATIPENLNPFLKKYMNDPVLEEIPSSTIISPTVSNYLLATKSKDKNQVIFDLLTIGQSYLTIVFVNTRKRAVELSNFLADQGLKNAQVHGGVEPRERRRLMRQIRNGDFQYIVATDLASRGLDIEGVTEVINEDIPSDLDFFVHRVGRTGRNGRPGIAITLYGPDEEDEVDQIEGLGIKFQPKQLKDHKLVDAKDRNRRKHRRITRKDFDPELHGLVEKKKHKVKPGYRRQIKEAVKLKNFRDKKISQRTAARRKKHK